MAKVSVITTTHNRAGLLKKTIESVLAQSFTDFEYLICDDASEDNTARVVKSFIDERIKYYRRDKNFGNDSQPKNEAISRAKGEYVAFLDDDDRYKKDALKILYNYITATKAEVAYGDYINHEGKKTSPGWSIDFKPSLLQRMNFIAMPVVMVKRSALLEVGGFNEEIPKFKDWNLWLRLHKRGYSFVHVPIVVAYVYPQKQSISAKFTVETDEEGHYLPTFFDSADCRIYANKTVLGEFKPLKVAIFSLIWDRLDYTKRMARSMKKTAGYPFDYFVVDQGSTQDTIDWLNKQKWIKEIEFNKENIGIAKGWNHAVDLIKKKGDYDIIIKLDNDAEMLTKNWLRLMIEIFERNRRFILSPYVEGLEDNPGGVLRQRASGASPYLMVNDRILGAVPYLGGICWAAPKEVYDDFRFP